MDSNQLQKILKQRLEQPGRTFDFDQEEDKLRIEDEQGGKGMTLSLPGIVKKYKDGRETVIDDIVYHVHEALRVMNEPQYLSGKESQIFPVIRSTSFPTETKQGKSLLYEEHTAETRVYYAVDLESSYRLIDNDMMEEEGWTLEKIHDISRFNLRKLTHEMKTDEVAGNTFYFINENDGYDASRILDPGLLEDMNQQAEGELTVAVPHQDVLVFGDIVNKTGYDVLGQMAMSFFGNGRVPITALSFAYDNGLLEPIFILAKKKPEQS